MQHNIAISCFIILLLLSFTSCLEEKCVPAGPEKKITLCWNYHDKNGNNLLREELRQLTVYIFSMDNYFIKSFNVNRDEIEASECKSLELIPGDYKIISWANLLNRTQVLPSYPEPGIPLSDFKINLAGINHNNGYYLSSDSLFHAQMIIHVSDSPDQKYTFNFRREACYIRIIMEEFTIAPEIRMNGMQGGYDLEARILPGYKKYAPNITYDALTAAYRAELAILRPANTNQLNLELYNKQTGTSIYTLDLTAILRELRIDTEKDDEVDMIIRLRLLSGNRISVAVNNWNIIEDIIINM